ncbi:MAG TPA: SUF system NifU family Fe-S cluster assembly protein, partial [Opitutaceae bacterium]|nr:SUF system NifU family Fe-S cluster assembly protein [Opitutaceae bacterium]
AAARKPAGFLQSCGLVSRVAAALICSQVPPVELSDLYQEIILEHARHPRHHGPCTGATHAARAENPTCGDEVEVHLRLAPDGRIEEATFTGQGCALSQASASLLTTKVRGRPVTEVLSTAGQVQQLFTGTALTPEQLDTLGDLQALQGAAQFPQRVKCVTLAWHALQQALGASPPPSAAT